MIDWDCACWGSKLKEAHGKTNEFWVISGECSLSLLGVLKINRMNKRVKACIEGIYKRVLNS